MDRKSQILETAEKYFSEKGFHSTSIQDIADHLNMSKGSLYFYFKSKDELLLSICRNYVDQFLKQIQVIMEDSKLSPRQKLHRTVSIRFQQAASSDKQFIALLLVEGFEMTAEIHEMMKNIRLQSFIEIQQFLIAVYGEDIAEYSYDAALLLNSMIDSYTGLMTLQEVALDHLETADFVLNRMDDFVKGMRAGGDKPLLHAQNMDVLLFQVKNCRRRPYEEIYQEIEHIRERLKEHHFVTFSREEAEDTLNALQEEVSKAEPKSIVIKGLLTLLKAYKISGIKRSLAELDKFIEV